VIINPKKACNLSLEAIEVLKESVLSVTDKTIKALNQLKHPFRPSHGYFLRAQVTNLSSILKQRLEGL